MLGKVKSIKTYNSNGTVDFEDYDEQGRLIERISYLPNCNEMGGEASSAYVRTLHEYFDHDEYGNWLSVINYDLDDKGIKHIIDTNRREIEYY